MRQRFGTIGTMILGGALVFALLSVGVVSLDWPWKGSAIASTETAVTIVRPVKVVRIEPIALDCRARVTAEVPLEGRREHRLLGQVYRTDTVQMTAIGDVDTCVESGDVMIERGADGAFSVVVPGEAIRFVRPRVDAVRTAESVEVDKGFVGHLTDVFPWVSESNGLTESAYAFAQGVVGGTDCMRAAYDATSEILVAAYRDQMIERGGNADDIEVRIAGEPDFDQNPPTELDGVEFEVATGGITCEVAADAVVGSVDTDDDTR